MWTNHNHSHEGWTCFCFQFSWNPIVRLAGVERVGGELDFRPEEDGSFQLAGNRNQTRILIEYIPVWSFCHMQLIINITVYLHQISTESNLTTARICRCNGVIFEYYLFLLKTEILCSLKKNLTTLSHKLLEAFHL